MNLHFFIKINKRSWPGYHGGLTITSRALICFTKQSLASQGALANCCECVALLCPTHAPQSGSWSPSAIMLRASPESWLKCTARVIEAQRQPKTVLIHVKFIYYQKIFFPTLVNIRTSIFSDSFWYFQMFSFDSFWKCIFVTRTIIFYGPF